MADNSTEEHDGSGEEGGGGGGLLGTVAVVSRTGAYFLPAPVTGTVVALALETTKLQLNNSRMKIWDPYFII